MNKYILLRAEDAERIQAALNKCASDLSSYADMEDKAGYEDGAQALHYSTHIAREALALIRAPIEVSEEAREFVSSIRKGDGFNPRMALTDDEATAMLAARDKCTRDKAIRDCLEYIMIKGPSILHTLLKED